MEVNKNQHEKTNKGKGNRQSRNTPQREGKSRNKNKKFKNKEARFDEKALRGETEASNDAGWYGIDSVLTKDAANVPFNRVVGLPINLSDRWGTVDSKVFPGVMGIQVVPTPGICGTWNDPVNVAIRDLYSEIRRANSGAKNYDAANLGMYLQVYDSACTYYAWMVRAYGLLRSTIVGNRYTPEFLINVMGLDYNNLVENMANFRAYINTYAARLFALKVPSKWHVIERHMWMFSNVFADAPNTRAQFYVFIPKAFWKYTLGETSETTGLFLEEPANYYKSTNVYTQFQRIKEFGDELLNSVLNDEDFNIMSGDIIKTFGDKVFRLNMIDEMYAIAPVYDPEVLMQIHNMTVVNMPSSLDKTNPLQSVAPNWSIVEDYSEGVNVGALKLNASIPVVSDYTMGTGSYVANQNIATLLKNIIDVPIDNPNPAITVVATRLQIAVSRLEGEAGDNYVVPYAYGTEIVTNVFIAQKSTDGTITASWYGDNTNATVDQVFADRPIVRKANATTAITPSTTNAIGLSGLTIEGPIDNYTLIDRDTLYGIHRAALMGMYEMTK